MSAKRKPTANQKVIAKQAALIAKLKAQIKKAKAKKAPPKKAPPKKRNRNLEPSAQKKPAPKPKSVPRNPDFHPSRKKPHNPNRKRRNRTGRAGDIDAAVDALIRMGVPREYAEKIIPKNPPKDKGYSIEEDSAAAADFWERVYPQGQVRTVMFHENGAYTVFQTHGNAIRLLTGEKYQEKLEALGDTSSLAIVRIDGRGEIIDTLWERNFSDYPSDG